MKRKTTKYTATTAGRQDHEMVVFDGVLIPVLGTVGGTAEESRQTAENIERFLAAAKQNKRKAKR